MSTNQRNSQTQLSRQKKINKTLKMIILILTILSLIVSIFYQTINIVGPEKYSVRLDTQKENIPNNKYIYSTLVENTGKNISTEIDIVFYFTNEVNFSNDNLLIDYNFVDKISYDKNTIKIKLVYLNKGEKIHLKIDSMGIPLKEVKLRFRGFKEKRFNKINEI